VKNTTAATSTPAPSQISKTVSSGGSTTGHGVRRSSRLGSNSSEKPTTKLKYVFGQLGIVETTD
jgi:hypothetical protein